MTLSPPERAAAGRPAPEGPDQEGPHRNLPPGQPAGPPGEAGQGAARPGGPGALHRGEEG